MDQGSSNRRRPPAELGKLFDKLPPHSIEAEMSLLGSMILDPRMVGDVLTLIETSDAFYSEKHAVIFDAVRDVYDRTQSGDLVQIAETLKDRGQLDALGGADYMVQLAESVPSAANAVHYARIVRDKSRLRKLIDKAGQILYDAYTGSGEGAEGVQEILERAEMAVFEVARADVTGDPQRLAELLQAELERLESVEGKGISGIKTGYHKLDEKLSGLHDGELIIIAARPSMGKTALALNLAEQIALGGGTPGSGGTDHCPVGFFSLEMSKSAVVQRLLSAYSGIDSHKLRTGRFTKQEFQRDILPACGALAEAPIYIDDTPGLTVLGLRARARRMVAQHGVKIIMIDYLQLLTSPSQARESRQVEVSAISRGIKALARELSVPVVCLAQLNRSSEQREGNRPRMSDLRESGSIEQDADVVALLHREEYYHQDDEWRRDNPEKIGLAELIIAKQRNGPTGTIKLGWDSSTTRFKNHVDEYDYSEIADPYAVAESKPGAFAGRTPTGPVANHRDGGGPDIEELPV